MRARAVLAYLVPHYGRRWTPVDKALEPERLPGLLVDGRTHQGRSLHQGGLQVAPLVLEKSRSRGRRLGRLRGRKHFFQVCRTSLKRFA